MLFPNLAYNSTFKDSISSRTVLSLLSIVETDSSILAVDELSISCTSGNGNDMNVSPILYLWLHQQETSTTLRPGHTGFCPLHQPTPVRSKALPSLPYPSEGAVRLAVMAGGERIVAYSFDLQLVF